MARYRVRETLARVGFPTDAVGETADVSGTIVFFGADGSVQPEHSKVIVDLSTLRSDRGRRDNFLRRNIFESDRFPTAEFVVRSTEGLSWPLQTSGEASFSLLGDITVHGVTRPAKWEVSAQFDGDSVQGLARTSFTFDTFDMKIPRFAFILSVQDDIRLEVDFVAAINTSS